MHSLIKVSMYQCNISTIGLDAVYWWCPRCVGISNVMFNNTDFFIV
jgi:hypothetical protein